MISPPSQILAQQLARPGSLYHFPYKVGRSFCARLSTRGTSSFVVSIWDISNLDREEVARLDPRSPAVPEVYGNYYPQEWIQVAHCESTQRRSGAWGDWVMVYGGEDEATQRDALQAFLDSYAVD